jgi:hypothetical protein
LAHPTVQSFLRKGLLPDNLPSFISSRNLVEPVIAGTDSYVVTQEVSGRPSSFNSSKRGFQRRTFTLPHPVFARDAALFFVKHETFLNSHFDKSVSSASRPDFSGTSHRAIRFTPHADLPSLRLKRLATSRYCLVTDISRCFPSIYTHSIPWALHGKDASKADRKTASASVFGNRLDYIMRQSQDGQTMGIPVGPDHSRVIAEIVLTALDAEMATSGGFSGYLRHVDDFWIGCDSIEMCEDILQVLRKKLHAYALDINEQKTRIVLTSSVIAETWPYSLEAQLDAAMHLEVPARHSARIISLLGSVVKEVSNSSDDGILKFFLRKFDTWQQWDRHWITLESFLAHCALHFLHAFDYIAQIVSWRKRTDKPIDIVLWQDIALRVLSSAAKAGRDAEALWAIWLCKELDQAIPADICSSIADNNGPLVCSSLPHLFENNLINGAFNLSDLWMRVEGQAISSSAWPLALELACSAVPPTAGHDLDGPAAFQTIFNAECSLFTWHRPPSVFLDEDDELENSPLFALGELGSDYDDDESESDITSNGFPNLSTEDDIDIAF